MCNVITFYMYDIITFSCYYLIGNNFLKCKGLKEPFLDSPLFSRVKKKKKREEEAIFFSTITRADRIIGEGRRNQGGGGGGGGG